MHHRLVKIGLAGASALTASLVMAMPQASADYAPSAHDVVGVGSDTLQYASDFVADGSYTGSAGYNTALNKYKIINFDATPDANARLAYGPLGATSAVCSPGDGAAQGTGNDTSTHTDKPCALNPTIVLRAGTKPVQRPNGSGAGAKALAGDVANGTNTIDYARASSCQDTSCSSGNVLAAASYDVLEIGHDPLAMLTSSSTSTTPTNAPPLSAAELASIYKCTVTQWSQLDNGTTYTNLSSGTIIPIIPQVGSGTRSSFESAIGITDSQLGGCVVTSEENDPTAIAAQTSPANAIEPMSGARLNLFNGVSGSTNASLGDGGYFQDPSCSLTATGTNSGGDCTSSPTISPKVSLVTTGTPPDGAGVFDVSRGLYIYFRQSAVDTNAGWQPGSVDNAIRTLFYNPCDTYAQTVLVGGCVTVGGVSYGPGGQPYYAKSAGQADIAAAGISPAYAVSTSGASTLP